jgi:hypothetical protein
MTTVNVNYEYMAYYYAVGGIIGLTGSVLFCIGFVFLVQRVLGNRK